LPNAPAYNNSSGRRDRRPPGKFAHLIESAKAIH